MKLFLFTAVALSAQIADYPADTVAGIPVNYTDAAAGAYTLPDLLTMANGKPARGTASWVSVSSAAIASLWVMCFWACPGRI